MIFMAWIDAWDEAFDPTRHSTELSKAYSLSIKEIAGQAAVISVEVDNPGVAGLLAPSRRYAVFSERGPTDAVAVELARGRLVAVPSEFGTTFVTLEFHGLPPQDNRVHREFADTLRTADDWYDPLFHGPDASEEPSTAIEARPVDWHWDRRTLALRTTHLVESARTVDLGGEALDESLSMTLAEAPPSALRRRVVFSWTQRAKGSQTLMVGGGELQFSCFTASDFMGSFPRPGDSIGSGDSGWSWAEAACVDEGPGARLRLSAGGLGVDGAGVTAEPRMLRVRLRAAHDYTQQREEIVDLTLPLGIQPVLRDDRVETVEVVEVGGLTTDETTPAWTHEHPETLLPMTYKVGDRVQARGRAWRCVRDHTVDSPNFYTEDPVIGLVLWEPADRDRPLAGRSPSYVDTDRGMRSVKVALNALAREAILLARCVRFEFEVPWAIARDITCEDSVRVETRYVSGGVLVGKVVEVELTADDQGGRVGRVTLAVVPGLGGPPPVTDDEFEETTGDLVFAASGARVVQPVNAPGLRSQLPRVYELTNIGTAQAADMTMSSDPEATLAARPTQIVVGYAPLQEVDLLSRRLRATCKPLQLPRQIDLEAS